MTDVLPGIEYHDVGVGDANDEDDEIIGDDDSLAEDVYAR